jgi:hypothetical protein
MLAFMAAWVSKLWPFFYTDFQQYRLACSEAPVCCIVEPLIFIWWAPSDPPKLVASCPHTSGLRLLQVGVAPSGAPCLLQCLLLFPSSPTDWMFNGATSECLTSSNFLWVCIHRATLGFRVFLCKIPFCYPLAITVNRQLSASCTPCHANLSLFHPCLPCTCLSYCSPSYTLKPYGYLSSALCLSLQRVLLPSL